MAEKLRWSSPSPHPQSLIEKGWMPYPHNRGGIINLYKNENEHRIAAYRYVTDQNGRLKREWCRRTETDAVLEAMLLSLASAKRCTTLAEQEVNVVVEELMTEKDGDEVDEELFKKLDITYKRAIIQDLDEKSAMLREAARVQSLEDLERIKELCEELRHAKFNDLDKGALDPPTGELARHLWVGSNPELCKKILREFRGWSHRRNTGSLLTKVRKYLREKKILHEMVRKAYPKVAEREDYVNELCRAGTREKPALIHIDHFFAQLSDNPSLFVAMIAPANGSFSALDKYIAKDLYVDQDVADEMREVALEMIGGVRARVSEARADRSGDVVEDEPAAAPAPPPAAAKKSPKSKKRSAPKAPKQKRKKARKGGAR